MSIFKKKIPGMLTDKVIRAADYLPKPKENGDSSLESFDLPQSERIVCGIFGDEPDYSKWKYERLWRRFHRADDDKTIAYCLKKGVDVLDDHGKPVPGFRDIAVMLKAIEKGYIELKKEQNT